MAKLHLIGNAHLDPVWLWRWQEGFAQINPDKLPVIKGELQHDFCEIMDYGMHKCSYELFPYTGNAKAQQTADEFNFGLRAVSTGFHSGNLPESDCCYQSQAEHIVVTAIKKSEDDEETVVRFYEADGQKEETKLNDYFLNERDMINGLDIDNRK